jgi:hypothetical protein
MIGIVLAAILAIVVIGLLLKLVKVALIVAACVAIVLVAQKKLASRQVR